MKNTDQKCTDIAAEILDIIGVTLPTGDRSRVENIIGRAVFSAKKEKVDQLHAGLSSLMKKDKLTGNGCDELAQNNGIVLALNYLYTH